MKPQTYFILLTRVAENRDVFGHYRFVLCDRFDFHRKIQ